MIKVGRVPRNAQCMVGDICFAGFGAEHVARSE